MNLFQFMGNWNCFLAGSNNELVEIQQAIEKHLKMPRYPVFVAQGFFETTK